MKKPRLNSLRRKETVIALCIQVVLLMMGIGVISPVLPQYARSFGVSITMVGLLTTAFGVARIMGDIPAGQLSEKLGRRPVLIAGPLVVALASVACGLAESYWQLVVFRFIQGAGSALHATATMIVLADISTPANRGQVMSWFQGSFLIGTGLGPVLGGFVAQYFGLQAPFFALALFAGLSVFWAYFRIPETKAIVHEVISTPGNPKRPTVLAQTGFKPLLGDISFMLICFINFGIIFMRQGAQNQLLPLLASERLGLNAGQVGMALTVVALTTFVALFFAGRLSDQFGRKAIITPGCLITAISLVMLAQSYSHWFLLLTCGIMGIGSTASGPTLAAYVADTIRRENYGHAMGLFRTIGDLGFVVGPVLLGWLADLQGFSFSLLFNSIFLLLAVLAFQALAKEPHRKEAKAMYPDGL